MYSIVNLESTVRTTPGYIQVAGIVLERDVKRWGAIRVFSGVDPETRKPDPKLWATPGAQLRAMDLGTPLNLPHSPTPTLTCGWVLLVVADMLAAHKLNPFVESPSAYCPCRECAWDTRSPHAYQPVSFMKEGETCRWKCYTTDDLETALKTLRALPISARTAPMQDMGINSVDHALCPDYVPKFRCAEGQPQDEMHAEDDGLLRAEAYQLLNVTLRKWKPYGFTLDRLNAALLDWNWEGRTIPPLHQSVLEGAKGGVPSQGAHLRYTASQTVTFSRALQHIMAPFIHDPKEPAWLSWLAHMYYFELKMARQFDDESILALEQAVVDHQLKFDGVPEYAGLFIYKHHAALHSARNIYWCGPAILRTARMFENKLQYVKRRAAASNFKNPIFSVHPP